MTTTDLGGLGVVTLKAYPSLSNSSKRTTLKRSNTKKTMLPNGTTSIITTSALMFCTRSRKKESRLLPILKAKS